MANLVHISPISESSSLVVIESLVVVIESSSKALVASSESLAAVVPMTVIAMTLGQLLDSGSNGDNLPLLVPASVALVVDDGSKVSFVSSSNVEIPAGSDIDDVV